MRCIYVFALCCIVVTLIFCIAIYCISNAPQIEPPKPKFYSGQIVREKLGDGKQMIILEFKEYHLNKKNQVVYLVRQDGRLEERYEVELEEIKKDE